MIEFSFLVMDSKMIKNIFFERSCELSVLILAITIWFILKLYFCDLLMLNTFQKISKNKKGFPIYFSKSWLTGKWWCCVKERKSTQILAVQANRVSIFGLSGKWTQRTSSKWSFDDIHFRWWMFFNKTTARRSKVSRRFWG